MNPFKFAGSAPLALIHAGRSRATGLAMDKRRKRTAHLEKAGWEAEQNRAALLSLLTDSDSWLFAVGSHSLRFPDPSSQSQQYV